jgi:hypothetical protein
MSSTRFALSAASLFLAAACGGSSATPAPAEPAATPAASEAPAEEAGHAAPAEGQVKCLGINACSGQAACDMPGAHGCAGQNECKGKGWILASAEDCSAKGGTVKP